jgi:hypothetical protein
MVAAAINDLCGKPREQCLRPFRAINHVELSFGLGADDALIQALVVWEKPIKSRKLWAISRVYNRFRRLETFALQKVYFVSFFYSVTTTMRP